MPRKLKTYQTSQGFYACHRPRELAAFGFWSLAAGAVWLDRMFSRLAGAQRGNRIEENPFSDPFRCAAVSTRTTR
jgi:hypothetical protein